MMQLHKRNRLQKYWSIIAMQFIVKVLISALIITLVSELAKRYTFIAAITASLPLTSMLAIIWLHHATKDVDRVIDLSNNIFWAVLPSLLFFIVFPILLKIGLRFSFAMIVSSVTMFLGYTMYAILLHRFGIQI